MVTNTKATAEQLPWRIHRAAEHINQIKAELQLLSDDCWEDDRTVRLSPPLQELRELIDAVQLLQDPLNEIHAATGRR